MAYRVEQQAPGRHVVTDGHVVLGPYPTNADAWRALDRLAGDDASPSEARASWGFKRAAIAAPYARPKQAASSRNAGGAKNTRERGRANERA